MKSHAVLTGALVFAPCGFASIASAKSELKGAAILDPPCGKVSVKQMGLVRAGKMEEANKLTIKEMQAQWKAMPANDHTTMRRHDAGGVADRGRLRGCNQVQWAARGRWDQSDANGDEDHEG